MKKFEIILIIKLILIVNFVYGANRCYVCSGTNCLSNLNGFISQNCSTLNDPCVTFYNQFTPTRRACFSSLNATDQAICNNSTNLICSKCDDDNCNIFGREDHKCVTCSSIQNRTCLTKPETLEPVRCAAPLYADAPLCYIKSIGIATERGCVVTKSDLDFVTNVNNTKISSTCNVNSNTPSCNNYEFPIGRIKCRKCASTYCINGNDILDYCDKPDDTCMVTHLYEGERAACKSDVSADDLLDCFQYPNRCMECNDVNGCNVNITFSKISCRVCNSLNNDTCVSDPKSFPLSNCNNGCISYLTETYNGVYSTRRDCYESNMEICERNANLCSKCLNDDCNSGIFPANRLSCYECGQNCNTIANSTLKMCAGYRENEECVSMIKNGTISQVGCLTSLTTSEIAQCTSKNSCIMSYCGSSGCNNPKFISQTLTCLQCSSTSKAQCTTNPSSLPAISCAKEGQADSCYTKLIGTQLERGCLSDLNVTQSAGCGANSTTCNTCKDGIACNRNVFPPNRLFCHQCDSKTKSNCNEKTTGDPEMCLNYYADNKCYSIVQNNGTVLRTCSNNKNEICKNTSTCIECSSNGCNNEKISSNKKGSGSTINLSATLIAMMLVILSLLIK